MSLNFITGLVLSFFLMTGVSPYVVKAEDYGQVVRKAQKNIVVKQVKQKSLLEASQEAYETESERVESERVESERVESEPSHAGTAKHPIRKRLAKKSSWENQVNTKLWKLYNAGQFTTLKKLVETTKRQHKGWQAPKKLISLVGLVKADKRLSAAQEKGDFKVALDIYKYSPESFSCKHLGWVFFLAEAQVQAGSQKQALSTYQRVMKSCSNIEKVAALEHGQGVLLIQNWQPLVEREYQSSYKGEAKKRLNKLWYKLQLKNLQYASDHGDIPTAIKLSDQLQKSVLAYKDSGGAEILAWTYLRGKSFAKANKNFVYAYRHTGNPDMLRGQALALASSGRIKEVDVLVEKHRETFEKNHYMADITPVLIEHAFSVKAYKKSIQLLLELKDIRPLTVGDMSILAWSYYHLNQFEEAAAVFQPLYVLKSDSEVARGLYYSLLRLGDEDKMFELADKLGGSFEDFVERDRATKLYYKHQYLAAHARGDVYSEVLSNIDEPYVRLSYMQKNSPSNAAGGAAQFSRMKLQKTILEGRDVFSGVHELSARIEFLKLDASERNLPKRAEVGTVAAAAGGVYAIPNPETVHKGIEWSLGYRYENQGSIYAEVGQLNVATAIKDQNWKFRLGYSRSFDERSFQIEAYRQPLRETLLSYVGMTDPYGGTVRWGQVSRNGAALSLYQALPVDFSVNLTLVGETRRGYNVKTNNYYSAYLGLPYNLAASRALSGDNFEQFSIGPYARMEDSSMDQNHFTVGHGGYYSPQYLRDFGINLDVLTKARKAWMLSLRGSVGRQSVRMSPSLKLPLSATNKARYVATSNKESHYQIDVAAVIALTDYVRLNAEYKTSRSWSPQTVNASPAFTDQAFMISLTVHFDPRGKQLLQDDIPSYRLQPLY